MVNTVRQINAVIEELWPTRYAEPWDRPGLLVGSQDAPVERIHLAVDAVAETVQESVDLAADVLLVHHPLLLRPLNAVVDDQYKGALITTLIRSGCALIAAHTNADIVANGVSDIIARRLGLIETAPIVPGEREGTGTGRVGRLAEPSTLGRLALSLAELLPATATGIRVAGQYDEPISTVSLCGGAGDSLLGTSEVRASDVYITSDLRHHPASESREQSRITGGPALIDISHWAAEWLWLDTAAQALRTALPDVTVTISDIRTDPWDFVVTQ
jgi:dinuclear metal center YbgI/SA1388 family protein